jgi:hypothetical protein
LPEKNLKISKRSPLRCIQTLLNALAKLLAYPIERLVERSRGLTHIVGHFTNRPIIGVCRSDQAS